MRFSKTSKQLVISSCLLLSCFSLSGCSLGKSGGQTLKPSQAVPEPTKPLETTIMDRPYVSVVPTADGHWISLNVSNIKSGTKSIEYELIYFAVEGSNQIERGTTGLVELKGERTLSRKILFGTESCTTGKCKYRFEENVSEGTLTLKMKTDAGTEKYQSAFKLQKGKEAKEGLATGDGNFKFIADGLSGEAYFLTISTVGLPGSLPGTIATLPYGIFPEVSGKGTVFFKTDLTSAKIYYWTGSKWEGLSTSSANGWVSASTTKTGVFALVK